MGHEFLFSPTVTRYLRELWLDGVRANLAAQIALEHAQGDREAELEVIHNLTLKHTEYERLRLAFKEMSVNRSG